MARTRFRAGFCHRRCRFEAFSHGRKGIHLKDFFSFYKLKNLDSGRKGSGILTVVQLISVHLL